MADPPPPHSELVFHEVEEFIDTSDGSSSSNNNNNNNNSSSDVTPTGTMSPANGPASPPYYTARPSMSSTTEQETPSAQVTTSTQSAPTVPGPPIKLAAAAASAAALVPERADVIDEKSDLAGSSDPSVTNKTLVADAEAATQVPSALLNLPPPPPFDLDVEGLTVGVPYDPLSWYIGRAAKLLGDASLETADKETAARKTILSDVSCTCASGEVLAILGGSGSGKTTLLNAVAHRLANLPVRAGDVQYVPSRGGNPLGHREARRRIGFVRQQDYLVECLTVRETLTYAARLRLPTSLSRETIDVVVEETLDELGLRDAADTVVGGPLRKGISGGEKRRLSIGCVLVTLPSVLILDEPTSGLDAYTSYLLLRTLNALARRGRTVILSIHAPRSDAFELFDRICLLSKGKVVYSGMRSLCLPWFAELGHTLEDNVNPLDFLIDLCSIDNRTVENEEESKARVSALTNAWEAHLQVSSGKNQLALLSHSHLVVPATNPLARHSSSHSQEVNELHRTVSIQAVDSKRPGWFLQTRILTARAHRNVYRNVPILFGLCFQGVALGCFIGGTFYKIPETPQGIQSLKNLSFQFMPSVFYLQQVFWVYKWCTDLVIFDREREDNLYDVVPYVISDWLSYLAPAVFSPTVYIILVYFMAELRMDEIASRLFTIIASTILVQFATQGLALFAAAVTREFAVASLVANAINIFQLLSAGFILVEPPVYAAWIRWLSPYFYSFRIVATVLFKDRTFACPSVSQANLEQCDGNNVLRSFRFNLDTNIGAWFGGLIAFALFEYAFSCLILWAWHAGGVRHASEIDSHHRGKQADVADSHLTRDLISVSARHLSLAWERRGRGLLKSSKKVILEDICVTFPPGQVSAILGPSGAGKSTFLQLLASRKLKAGALAGFYLKGEILFNGQAATHLSMSNVAFVEQEDDWQLPSLTVRETLRYAAILRLPQDMPRKQKIARAETVLRMLGLKDCADLPVGGQLIKGISGGEKRRLSLAVQMINDPAVLLVDEPTSGLDSSIALSVMQVLKDIAATGRTVIATIHQPRSDIWKLADNVTLLARGGHVAYSGKRADAIPYFTSIGYPMPTEFFNPADHLLDIVSVDPRPALNGASAKRVGDMVATWSTYEAKETGDEDVSTLNTTDEIHSGAKTTPMRIALPVVLVRHWTNIWRQKGVFMNRWMQAPFVGALFIFFFQRLTHGPQGAQDRIGITIQSSTALAFVGVLNAVAIFPPERDLYFHEANSSARYSSATFVLMYSLVEIGPQIFGALAYSAIMNVGVGMQTSVRIFFEYFVTIFCLLHMGESFSMLFGAWISVEGLTVTLISTFISLAAQISGVVSLSLPDWLAAVAWATCVKGAVLVQVINECVGLEFTCSDQDIADGQCVATTGEQMLALFGWNDLRTAMYVGIVLATAFAWRFVAYLAISAKVGGFR